MIPSYSSNSREASLPPISHMEGLGSRADIPWQTELLSREALAASMSLSSRRRYGGMAETSPPSDPYKV
jgi:hypothetical protein